MSRRARRAPHGAGRAAIRAQAADRQVTPMRDFRPARYFQYLLETRRGIRTRDREISRLLLYPSELACWITALANSRYAHSQRDARQPAVRNRTAAKCRDKDLLTTPRSRDASKMSRPLARDFKGA